MRLTDIDVLLKQWCENACSSKFCIGEKCSEYKTLENATIIDAIPVIRCKDCLHYKQMIAFDGKCVCDVFDWISEPEDYCSFAEQKEVQE